MAVTILAERPDTEDAIRLLTELDIDLSQYDYPAESCHAFSVEKLISEGVAFFVTSSNDIPAGCGGVKLFGLEYGEIKRMYVRPQFRGHGLGKAMLDRLAEFALTRAVHILRLETGIYQIEAIGLYERCGFQRRAPFGEYRVDPMSVYLEKIIP